MSRQPHGSPHGAQAARPDRAALLAVLGSAVLWGTLWIPLRRMHAAADGPLATALGFALPLLLLLPMALSPRRRRELRLRRLLAPVAWLALGIALYAEGLLRGDVARVVLLFYLAPVWATLLARIVLGEPIAARRLATLALGLGGLASLFGPAAGGAAARTAGDWMGLAGGLAWSIALVQTRSRPLEPLFDAVLAHFVLLAPLFLCMAWLPGGATPEAAHALPLAAIPWVFAFGLLWMLPVVALTLFGAGRLDPGRFAILLMFEIVVALGTAAALTDEPFGAREAIGAGLILASIAVEVRGFGAAAPKPPDAPG
jgi:drug/metabolite transporter (DMT)-like permease